MSDATPASTSTTTAAPASADSVAASTTANTGSSTPAVSSSSTSPASLTSPAAATGTQATETAAPAATQVPTAYNLKLAPDSGLPPEMVGKVSEFAKGLGLNNEQAQKLLDAQSSNAKASAAQVQDQIKAQSTAWEGELKADKDFGGDKYTGNVEAAQSAFKQFGSHELTKALNDSGYSNFPPLLKAFSAIGKAMREDSFAGGDGTGGKPSADALMKSMYPTMVAG